MLTHGARSMRRGSGGRADPVVLPPGEFVRPARPSSSVLSPLRGRPSALPVPRSSVIDPVRVGSAETMYRLFRPMHLEWDPTHLASLRMAGAEVWKRQRVFGPCSSPPGFVRLELVVTRFDAAVTLRQRRRPRTQSSALAGVAPLASRLAVRSSSAGSPPPVRRCGRPAARRSPPRPRR